MNGNNKSDLAGGTVVKPRYIEHENAKEFVLRQDDGTVIYISNRKAAAKTFITIEDSRKATKASIAISQEAFAELAIAVDKMTGGILHKDCPNCDNCERIDPENVPESGDGMGG